MSRDGYFIVTLCLASLFHILWTAILESRIKVLEINIKELIDAKFKKKK